MSKLIFSFWQNCKQVRLGFTDLFAFRFENLNIPSMKDAIDYKYDQLFQQFGVEVIKVGKVVKCFISL